MDPDQPPLTEAEYAATIPGRVNSIADALNERLADLLGGMRFEWEGTGDQPEPGLAVTKNAAYLEVSEELLMDFGVIPDTREHKPIPRRKRFRWWLSARRERAAELAYQLIAGHDVPESDY